MDKNKYSKVNLGKFKWLEHIRYRPTMYLGRVNLIGFTEMLKGLFSNTLNDLKANRISFEIIDSKSAILKVERILLPVIDNWSKWNQNSNKEKIFILEFQVLNALCSSFKIDLFDKTNKSIFKQEFKKGRFLKGDKYKNEIKCSQLEIKFTLDELIWGENFKWNENILNHEIKEFAYLYNEVKFSFIYKLDDENCNFIYFFRNGLKDRLEIENLNSLMETCFQIQINGKIESFNLDVSFAFRSPYGDQSFLKSYVNDFYTYRNGSHVKGVIKGLSKGIKKYILKHNIDGDFKISNSRIKEHLIAVISIRMSNPKFYGGVRNKLANKEIIKPIENYVSNILIGEMEMKKETTEKLLRLFEV